MATSINSTSPWSCLASLAVIVCALQMTAVASAQDLVALMPGAGQSVCYGRVYDRSHLASHPDQLVTSMVLELKATNAPPHREETSPYPDFDFLIGLTLRGNDRQLVTRAGCHWATDRKSVVCGVDCDMGRFEITSAKQSGSLLLTLDRLSFEADCGGEGQSTEVNAGKDDKIFRLDEARPTLCQPLR